MSAVAGALAAALHIQLPVAIGKTLLFLQNAAAPTALFVLRRHRGAAPVRSRALGSPRRDRDQRDVVHSKRTAGVSVTGWDLETQNRENNPMQSRMGLSSKHSGC